VGTRHLIINARARRAQRWLARSVAALWAAGVAPDQVTLEEEAAALVQATGRAVAAGAELVIVAGGDGTLSLLVDCLAYREVMLGVLPLGTGNDFARGLGIPMDLEAAARVVASGRRVRVSLLRVDGDYAVNTVNIGANVHLARLARGLKPYLGRLAYLYAAGEGLAANRRFEGRMEANGWVAEGLMTQFGIVSGPVYAAGQAVNPEAEPGTFLAYAIPAGGRWQVTRMVWSLRGGRDLERRGVKSTRAMRARISTTVPEPVAVDGEVSGTTPVTVEVARDAITVMVPHVP